MLQNWAYNRDGPRLVKRARLFSRPDMFLAYTLLFSIGLVLTAPYYLWRLRGRITRWADWRERLGWLPKSFQQAERGAVWIHAVSVGETIAVVPLVKAIRESSREVKIKLGDKAFELSPEDIKALRAMSDYAPRPHSPAR